ncbi:hypothetical protein [Thalassobellus citreus]|uniref:hypothetical protein n=1 Tax=Thalassobellus citreus TaxID=3367752 RepID=UPI0037A4A0AC
MKKITLLIFIFLLASCFPNTKKDALKKFKNIIENKPWCEIKSKNKFIFKEGYLKQIKNEESVNIGKYKLDVRPNHGLTNEWFFAIQKIEISIYGNNKTYSLELNSPLQDEILSFKNNKTKESLFFSNDCILTEEELFAYKMLKEYKSILLNNN